MQDTRVSDHRPVSRFHFTWYELRQKSFFCFLPGIYYSSVSLPFSFFCLILLLQSISSTFPFLPIYFLTLSFLSLLVLFFPFTFHPSPSCPPLTSLRQRNNFQKRPEPQRNPQNALRIILLQPLPPPSHPHPHLHLHPHQTPTHTHRDPSTQNLPQTESRATPNTILVMCVTTFYPPLFSFSSLSLTSPPPTYSSIVAFHLYPQTLPFTFSFHPLTVLSLSHFLLPISFLVFSPLSKNYWAHSHPFLRLASLFFLPHSYSPFYSLSLMHSQNTFLYLDLLYFSSLVTPSGRPSFVPSWGRLGEGIFSSRRVYMQLLRWFMAHRTRSRVTQSHCSCRGTSEPQGKSGTSNLHLIFLLSLPSISCFPCTSRGTYKGVHLHGAQL